MTSAVSGLTIFRSSHPEVLAAWRNAEVEVVRHQEAMIQQVKAWGFEGHDIWTGRDSFGGSTTLQGISADPKVPLPAGWRLDRGSTHRAVPARSTAPGKVIAAQWDAIRSYPNTRKSLESFGMPLFVFAGLQVGTYAARVVADVLWIQWPTDPKIKDNPYFERVPLSAYYAMVEADQDPFADEAPVSENVD